VTWQFAAEKEYGYFRFVWNRYRALYSTIHGQEFLIQTIRPIFLKQTHSANIIDVDSEPGREGDGLTGIRDNCLGIKVADCLPVYLFSEERISLIHCGWRGIIAGIAKKAKKMMNDFHYALGASIGPCCYEVKDDVAGLFKHEYNEALAVRNAKHYLDLKSAVIKDLGSQRLLGSLDLCTKCHPELFYSHRRGDTQRNYAMLSYDTVDAPLAPG
jgi:YfiH family protein